MEASTSTEFSGRVDGAEEKIRSLAERIEAFFTALAEPPPTPPWKAEAQAQAARSNPADLEQIERLQRLIKSNQTRADMAEARAKEFAQEIAELKTELIKSKRDISQVRGPIGVDPETFQELERELETTRLELEEVRKAHAQALDQIASESPLNQVNNDSVVRAARAEEAVMKMQQHMQQQLLEQEELRRSRDEMRTANQRLRDELRLAQQKRDKYKSKAESGEGASSRVKKLESRLEKRDKEVEELQAQLRSLQRDLETQEKREQHLRRHLSSGRR
jgi:chromosome segregation ATPase